MAYTRRSYSGNAPLTNLSGSLTNAATSFAVLSGTGYPDGSGGNFVVCIDRGTASEEKILCSARSGATFTVASSGRGWDGTSATAHTSNATVEHVLDAQDLDEANQAVVATLGTIAAKGDLLVGSAANAIAKVAVGADTTSLLADSTATDGVRWGVPVIASGEGFVAVDVPMTLASTAYDGPSLARAAGTWHVTATLTLVGTTAGSEVYAKLWDGTNAPVDTAMVTCPANNAPVNIALGGLITLSGSGTVKATALTLSAGVWTIKAQTPQFGGGNLTASHLVAMQVK